jgi:glycosyltransferase involved in cell wall biosynthesis
MLAHYYWPHRGGVEKHVEKLSDELIKRGHEITLITEQHDPSLSLEETYRGVKIYRIPFYACSSKRMTWTWMNEHDYLVENCDLVHVHDVFWWYFLLRFQFLFKPVYTTFHGYEGNKPPKITAVIHRKLVEYFSEKKICVGSFMKKWYYAKPDLVIYGATDFVSNTSKPINGVALFFGRFDKDTGIDIYVRAVDRIKIDKLTCCGEGSLEKEIVKHNPVKVKAEKWQDDLSDLIDKSKYIFVSRYLSILEAMKKKRLVVAVYDNEIKYDYLMCHPMHDNMIIAGTPIELADKVNFVIDHPEIEKKMIENAYLWAKDQTWKKLADQYESLWNQ